MTYSDINKYGEKITVFEITNLLTHTTNVYFKNKFEKVIF